MRRGGCCTAGVDVRSSKGGSVSVGAVGGAGGAAGGAGAAGVGGVGGGVGGPGGGSSSAKAVTPSQGTSSVNENSGNEISKSSDENKSMGVHNSSVNLNVNNNVHMSTNDFMQLRQTSQCTEMQETSMVDLKKLIEMMIAIQLLKAMNEGQ